VLNSDHRLREKRSGPPVAVVFRLSCNHGVRCSPAPIRGAGSSSRTRNTPPAVSTFDTAHTNAPRTRSRASHPRSRSRLRRSVPRASPKASSPSLGAAILVEPAGHLSMAPAEAVGRKADSDAHRKAPFGHRDHFARVAWHLVFLICSGRECHGRFAMSSRLGLRPDDAMFVPCVPRPPFLSM
jgi:hypothetical protein